MGMEDREASRNRERDLVLSPNEYAFISDQTKGNINVYVGPYKTSLANTDLPVFFDEKTKRFQSSILEKSIQTFAIAPENWYITLKNPVKDHSHPKNGTVNNSTELNTGHKINIPGPVSFALFPGQMAKVIKGHHLRSNQYLVVRVYDEISAKDNWSKGSVVKTTEDAGNPGLNVDQLTLGKLFIIKGTEVSFYIPPTGIEVVKDSRGEYIRNAVTLERLEYCILLDESGNKRYVRGPDVVFPQPTENFLEKNGNRKFKAFELSEIKGLYIKVIDAYTDKDTGKTYKEGDEIFMTGKDQMIYFPRPEHAIIKYGVSDTHYAVAIPSGEGRYILNRLNGVVSLIKGPAMYLPNPMNEVIVRRILDDHVVRLWFPGNKEAVEVNAILKAEVEKNKPSRSAAAPAAEVWQQVDSLLSKADASDDAEEGFSGDSFERNPVYTPPRTITLDTKYEGAVAINVWTGYAVMVISKTRDRKVIVGPQTYLLEYDETLDVASFSKGVPKSDKECERTVYLRILNNRVSDLVEAETRDYCKLAVKIALKVDFEGDPSKWFNVENYVKFLTDRFRSVIRSEVKKHNLQAFYDDAAGLMKDTLLGKEVNDSRQGYRFEENGMIVKDLEILQLMIIDQKIATALINSRHEEIQQSLVLEKDKRELQYTKENEIIKREKETVTLATQQMILGLKEDFIKKQIEYEELAFKLESDLAAKKRDNELKSEKEQNEIEAAKRQREREAEELALKIKSANQKVELEYLKAEVAALASKAEAITPEFIAALQAFGDKDLLLKMAESMAPLSILGGKSVSEVFANLLKGTKLEGVFLNVGNPAEIVTQAITSKKKEQ